MFLFSVCLLGGYLVHHPLGHFLYRSVCDGGGVVRDVQEGWGE